MPYAIRLHAKIEDDFSAIPHSVQIRILDAIRALADTPRPTGVKKLTNIKAGIKNAYRIRIGNYRIGYQIFDNELVISVVAAAERGSIYSMLKRRLNRQ